MLRSKQSITSGPINRRFLLSDGCSHRKREFGRCLLALVAVLAGVGLVAAQNAWPPAPPIEVPAEHEAGVVPPSVTIETVRPGLWRCTFEVQPPGGTRSVALAGSFNGWNRAGSPLTGPDEAGNWSCSLTLSPGKHLYKFVINEEQWIPDPRNTDDEHDGHSGRNSILRLGRRAGLRTSPAQLGDGCIEAVGLEHQPNQPRFFQPLAADRVLVRVQSLAHDIERAWVATKGDGLAEMHVVHEDALFALWEAQVSLPAEVHRRGGVHRVEYTFVLADGDKRVSDPNTYSRSFTEKTVFHTPDWARHAIWYQIMPDRFRNGEAANDPPQTRPWKSAWFTRAAWETQPDDHSFHRFGLTSRYYGGDIAGLEASLPYLRELGVNALYFNPVFKADSHHKYDATNYLHIDDHFGTKGDYAAVIANEDLTDPSTWKWTESDKAFLRFIEKAHEMGFHVIVDGVFNHVGRPHPAFQDVMKNGRNSPYADWFDVTSWEPFEYSGWAGFGELPEFKKSPDGLASDSLKEHIFNVTRRWMDPDGDGDPSDGIDGWRLDVPNEVPMPFWAEWRQVVKSVNPDAYITGEIWDRADAWLDGRHFDAVMNYTFSRAVVAWVMDREWKISVSEFDQRLQELRLAYPLPATLVMQNLMNSHDTDRLVSMAINPDRAYDHANRIQDNGPNYDNSKPPADAYAKARLVALLQMTYVGAPMVYYGDEAGMWGGDDPCCRKPMLWKELEPYDKPDENFVMQGHLDFYREIIKLRREHPALRTGSFETLLADDAADVWVFLRRDDNEQLIVALHASPESATVTVSLPAGAPNIWKCVFGPKVSIKADEGKLKLTVPPMGGIVLHSPTPK